MKFPILTGLAGAFVATAFISSVSFCCTAAHAAAALAPPAMYPADTWEGRGVAVLRVLNRLDSHVETLRIQTGGLAHYENLDIGVARCLQRAPNLPVDTAAWVDIQDTRSASVAFHGWMLAAEPSLGVFESPVYDVRVTGCEGQPVAPALPALVQPPVPPLPGAPPANDGAPTDSTTPDAGAPRLLPADPNTPQPLPTPPAAPLPSDSSPPADDATPPP